MARFAQVFAMATSSSLRGVPVIAEEGGDGFVPATPPSSPGGAAAGPGRFATAFVGMERPSSPGAVAVRALRAGCAPEWAESPGAHGSRPRFLIVMRAKQEPSPGAASLVPMA